MSEKTSENKDVIVTTNTVIVEMGAVDASLIKKLKLGKGELMTEINEIVDEISEKIKGKGEDKIFMPVVIIYERKTD